MESSSPWLFYYFSLFQALYYWLRTYLLERRDAANKSEIGRLAMAQNRMQQNPSAGGSNSLGLNDGSARMQSHGVISSDSQVHQVSQPSSGINSHDGGIINGQDSERAAAGEGGASSSGEPHLQQNSSNITDGGQNALRRSGALSLMASAASAFDAAKDIMEALRSKHNNLASELEVQNLMFL